MDPPRTGFWVGKAGVREEVGNFGSEDTVLKEVLAATSLAIGAGTLLEG